MAVALEGDDGDTLVAVAAILEDAIGAGVAGLDADLT